MDNATDELPIRAAPYQHQRDAYHFACGLFGLSEGGDAQHSIGSRGTALLMEMQSGDWENDHCYRYRRRAVPGRAHQPCPRRRSALHPRCLGTGV